MTKKTILQLPADTSPALTDIIIGQKPGGGAGTTVKFVLSDVANAIVFPSGSNGQIQYNNGGAVGGASQLYYDDVNDRVGIGTATPTQKLEVNGTIKCGTIKIERLEAISSGAEIGKLEGALTQGWVSFYEGVTLRALFGYGDGGDILSGASTNSISLRSEGDLHLGAGGNNLLLTVNSGGVGVGITAPTARLHAKGSGNTSGTYTAKFQNSDSADLLSIRDDGGFAFSGGTVGLAQTGYTTFTNLSTDRTCDANSTTVEELADILGTLIVDLKAKGIIAA